MPSEIRKLLVANRSEIAIRVFRAARKLGIRTVGIYSLEDRFCLHRFKADESYLVGQGQEPVRAYLGVAEIMRVAAEASVDAIHPGYAFLSENPEFAEACLREGTVFVGPPPDVMRRLGNKIEARALAESAGDIVKVTPTLKVVGDLALYMVTNGLSREDVLDPDRDIAFPESVVEFFHGDLGQHAGGFPKALQHKVLKGRAPLTVRPGEVLPAADLVDARSRVEGQIGRPVTDEELASYSMYPKVFIDFAESQRTYGDVSVLPTPTFYYGIDSDEEITVDLERGKTLIIRCLAVGEPDAEARRTLFFEPNGQPRQVKVLDRSLAPAVAVRRKAEAANPAHVAAPMLGMVVGLQVVAGQRVERGDRLLSIGAMKMETVIFAGQAGVVEEIVVHTGTQVEGQDLLIVLGPDGRRMQEPENHPAVPPEGDFSPPVLP